MAIVLIIVGFTPIAAFYFLSLMALKFGEMDEESKSTNIQALKMSLLFATFCFCFGVGFALALT